MIFLSRIVFKRRHIYFEDNKSRRILDSVRFLQILFPLRTKFISWFISNHSQILSIPIIDKLNHSKIETTKSCLVNSKSTWFPRCHSEANKVFSIPFKPDFIFDLFIKPNLKSNLLSDQNRFTLSQNSESLN